jgi:general secretion pathway protein K
MRVSRQKSRSTGFALVAVLWLLAGLTVVAALLADLALTSARQVAALQERNQLVLRGLSARAELQYWLSQATAVSNGYTRNEFTLVADARPYDFGQGLQVRVQDHFGYISLRSINRSLVETYLSACGVAAERASGLVDALEDYIDSDNLQRLNGAEADDYARARKLPPRNGPLASVDELWDVFGWREVEVDLRARGCGAHFTLESNAGLQAASPNANTAPERVLLALGLDADAASSAVEGRLIDAGVAREAADRVGAAQPSFMGMRIAGAVSDRLDVEVSRAGSPSTLRYTLVRAPRDDPRPWATYGLELGATSKFAPLEIGGSSRVEPSGGARLTSTIPISPWIDMLRSSNGAPAAR